MKILACLFTMKKLRSKNKNVDGDAGMCVCEGWGGGGWGGGGGVVGVCLRRKLEEMFD